MQYCIHQSQYYNLLDIMYSQITNICVKLYLTFYSIRKIIINTLMQNPLLLFICCGVVVNM